MRLIRKALRFLGALFLGPAIALVVLTCLVFIVALGTANWIALVLLDD